MAGWQEGDTSGESTVWEGRSLVGLWGPRELGLPDVCVRGASLA